MKDMLKTMGVSILVGGLSTFLAVIPLAFSTSAIISTVFTAFFSMVTLGVAHGLIFLPVILSIVGPTMTPRLQYAKEDTENDTKFESRMELESIDSESVSQARAPVANAPLTGDSEITTMFEV